MSQPVTLWTMSLTIWFARSKLLVFDPTLFSLLLALVTFTFLDFFSNAFFAWASFSFTCQARCLYRKLAITGSFAWPSKLVLNQDRPKQTPPKIIEKKNQARYQNSLIQSLLRPWLNRTVRTGEGRLRPTEWKNIEAGRPECSITLPVSACHVCL